MTADVIPLNDHQDTTASRIASLARQAPFYVATLREMMEPRTSALTAADLAPSGGKQAPKPPFAVEMLHRADLEAQSIGVLARYVVTAYKVPLPMKNVFWAPGGRIKGLHTDAIDSGSFQALCDALVDKAETIAAASAGDDHLLDLLHYSEELRDRTRVLVPGGSAPRWLTEQQARELTGRASVTLARWRYAGVVEYDTVEGDTGFLYREDSLRRAVVMSDNRDAFLRRRLVSSAA